jgi:gamma-glutamyltranspeptidase/glutathione hydrolase
LLLKRAGGRLPLSRLLRDAIYYAETGVAVTRGGAEIAASKDAELRDAPGYAAVYRPDGRPLSEGECLRQPALARTLRRIAEKGCADFYSGALAADIAADLEAVGSPVSAADLAAHRAEIRAPLSVGIRGVRLFNMAPPTQGLSSLLILALFDRLGVGEGEGFDHIHGLVEATKAAFARGRALNLGDPAFMKGDPQKLLDDAATIDAMAARIDRRKAQSWDQPTEPGDTTWFGAVDSDGRIVSAIQSIYFEFGSGVVLAQTGINWQNRGSSFQLSTSGWNALAPGRLPFHTLNPAIAKFDDGRVMAYGAMGGEGQPQTQAAVFTRYARFGVGLHDAVSAPRWLLGRTWGEESMSLKFEDRFDPSLYEAMRAAGHQVEILAPFTSTMGHAGALVRSTDGMIEGASDPRSDGAVAAW